MDIENNSKRIEKDEKENDKRFSDLWNIANETKSDLKVQAANIKAEIAESQTENAKGQTEIQVSLGKVITSVAYIEAEIKRGIVESTS